MADGTDDGAAGAKQFSCGEIPIVLGVTGHRDLTPEGESKLREIVKRELHALEEHYPHSPFVVLSSLAEGSDRLVADCALELGFSLIAPLPLPRQMYECDFSQTASVAKFREILSKSLNVVELPFLPGADEANTAEGPHRDKQYALSGAYVVRHSAILFALWDGEAAFGTGGTAEIVDYLLVGIPPWLEPDWRPFERKDVGAVYLIRTPRLRHKTPLPEAYSVEKRAGPGINAAAELSNELAAIDHYNAQCQKSGVKGQEKTPLERLEHRLHAADALAVYAQDKAKSALLKILALAFFFPLFLNQLSYRPSAELFACCALSIGAAYWLHYNEIFRHRYQAKHLEFRALAEALRVQFYWAVSGLSERVTPYFLYAHEKEGGWIRSAIRFATAELPAAAQPLTAEGKEKVLTKWIADQREYFEHAFRSQVSRNLTLSSLKFALLLLAASFKFLPDMLRWLATDPAQRTVWFVASQLVIIALVIGVHTWSRAKELASQRDILSVLKGFKPDFWNRPVGLVTMLLAAVGSAQLVLVTMHRIGPQEVDQSAHLFTLFSIAAASAAATIHLYGYLQAFSDNARRYGRLMALFARAEKLFAAAVTAEDETMLHTVIRSLGREALSEAGEWLRQQRGRPIEVPRV